MSARSRRVIPLPPDWYTRIRPRIFTRDDHRCQWPMRGGICGRPASDVDHRTPSHLGGTDDDDNLWALCREHHLAKTAQEAGAAAARVTAKRYRPTETHPGLIRSPRGGMTPG